MLPELRLRERGRSQVLRPMRRAAAAELPRLRRGGGFQAQVLPGLRRGPSSPAPQATAAATEGERRQVTVLFVDLAGYTTLASELDAEEVHSLLGRFFARADGIVEAFGGSVDKHIGDCVMAVFGAPLAHSDDPERAARAELAQFQGMLEACLESGAGQTIYLCGDVGIGKTRLVEEFRRQAEARGFAYHIGLVLDFGAGTGRDAIRALDRSLLDVEGPSGAEATLAAAERALAEGLLAADRRVHLSDLLDMPQPIELRALCDAMDNARRNRGQRETVAELVQAVSTRRPLLLVIEDVHWADRPTLDHLASLAQTVVTAPALLVMTSRVEGDPLDHAWRASLGGSPLLTIDLGPLRPKEAEALAAAYQETSREFARRCLERSAGNPLFLDQLLRHAEERAEGGVPGSVQSLVQARMDQLEPADKQALLAASVFGQRFSLDGLRYLIDRPRVCLRGPDRAGAGAP